MGNSQFISHRNTGNYNEDSRGTKRKMTDSSEEEREKIQEEILNTPKRWVFDTKQ